MHLAYIVLVSLRLSLSDLSFSSTLHAFSYFHTLLSHHLLQQYIDLVRLYAWTSNLVQHAGDISGFDVQILKDLLKIRHLFTYAHLVHMCESILEQRDCALDLSRDLLCTVCGIKLGGDGSELGWETLNAYCFLMKADWIFCVELCEFDVTFF